MLLLKARTIPWGSHSVILVDSLPRAALSRQYKLNVADQLSSQVGESQLGFPQPWSMGSELRKAKFFKPCWLPTHINTNISYRLDHECTALLKFQKANKKSQYQERASDITAIKMVHIKVNTCAHPVPKSLILFLFFICTILFISQSRATLDFYRLHHRELHGLFQQLIVCESRRGLWNWFW